MSRLDASSDNSVFATTQWHQVDALKTQHAGRRQQAMERVLGNYWRPLYLTLRKKWGCSHEKAEDMVQGFVEEKILRQQILLKADPRAGRLRSYLVTALLRYACSEYRAEHTQQRFPAHGLTSLDALASPESAAQDDAADPEQIFTAAWVSELIAEVLDSLEKASRRAQQEHYWEVFRRRVVDPLLHGTQAPSLSTLCQELNIESVRKASNITTSMKRRFRATLKARLRQMAGHRGDWREELADLLNILHS